MKTRSEITGNPVTITLGVWLAICVSACGDIDPNAYLEDKAAIEHSDAEEDTAETDAVLDDTESELPFDKACTSIEWGFSCKTDSPTYNITFDGLNVADNQEETVSLESLYCAGYDSVVIVIGDADCVACPQWYRALGNITSEIHALNAVIVSACTDGFGTGTLTDDVALSITEDMNPDYVTGDSPFKYPCRHEFTPYTTVIDLSDARILGKDSLSSPQLTTSDIITLLEEAARED